MYKNFVNPIRELADKGRLSGVLLILCTLISLLCANSIISDSYIAFWNKKLSIGILQNSIAHWINDGLMAIFFLLVGLEIKRELLVGELTDIKKSMLPVMAAIGGMAIPAIVFVFFNSGEKTINGWAIPTATDIAFSLGILSFLGNKIPFALKVFLTALAIIDDLGAIIIIAVFYTNSIAADYLLYASITTFILFLLNRFKVNAISLYLLLGLILWYCILKSGIHSTIAGVILALLIPLEKLKELEHRLQTPVSYFIIPLFALANTAILVSAESFDELTSSIGLGIILGLLIGKPLGIFLATYLAVKQKLCTLPEGVTFKHIVGVGFLAGIGFTMSIFIANLSFGNLETLNIAKLAVLLGSMFSAIAGMFILKQSSTKNKLEK
jgi:Na+:H+ antiporter, NhaA family